jgi:dipeptidase E
MADAERGAADIGVPAYALDEQTAIKVADGRCLRCPTRSGWE